jgi:oligopeptide/dipeptide ABC transporter ATP-binding protein
VLAVQNLTIDFDTDEGTVRAVDDVSFGVKAGETVCLVGESGCGKSITALSIGRLLASPPARYPRGEIQLSGRDVLRMSPAEVRSIRGSEVAYVFQEPGASLNPVQRVGNQVLESLRIHAPDRARPEEVLRLLKEVGIPAPEVRYYDYPHQMSGGMQQRIMIAMAVACSPKLLIADEPTTALDVTIQAQILELFRQLKLQTGMSLLLITHNLGIVKDLADRVLVMYAGQIVESGPTLNLLSEPLHPYTQALLRSIPQPGKTGARLKVIPGQVPRLSAMPSGCRFHPRCDRVQLSCSHNQPQLSEVVPGRWVRCPFAIPSTERRAS